MISRVILCIVILKALTPTLSWVERIGNPEHSNVYVCWPQQCVFIGADRRRVKYEDLTQSKWTARLTTMAAQETNPQIQRNMFLFIASLLEDVCDMGFAVGLGVLVLIVVMMEESHLSWLDLIAVQEVRDNRSVVAPSSSPVHSVSISPTQNSKPKAAQQRIM